MEEENGRTIKIVVPPLYVKLHLLITPCRPSYTVNCVRKPYKNGCVEHTLQQCLTRRCTIKNLSCRICRAYSTLLNSKMHLALSVVVVLLACVAAQDQQQYVVYRSPSYQAPYYGDSVVSPDDPRLFLPTTTTTTTSTTTVTCTKSTATACTGRKRRGILFDGEEEEQFPIVPSEVEGYV
jgi:hypothetical protein